MQLDGGDSESLREAAKGLLRIIDKLKLICFFNNLFKKETQDKYCLFKVNMEFTNIEVRKNKCLIQSENAKIVPCYFLGCL